MTLKSDRKKCPKCNSETVNNANFCEYCGVKIEKNIDKDTCEWCGKKIRFWENKRWNPIGEGFICEQCKNNPPINMKRLFPLDNISYPIIVRGWNGIISIYEDYVEVDRTEQEIQYPFRNLHGVKRIYFNDMISILFKKAGAAVGYIQFTIIGANDSQGFLDNHSIDNAISFNNIEMNDLWERLFLLLQNKLDGYKKKKETATTQNTNIISELDKAASLLKNGLISEDEFSYIKNKILNTSNNT